MFVSGFVSIFESICDLLGGEKKGFRLLHTKQPESFAIGLHGRYPKQQIF